MRKKLFCMLLSVSLLFSGSLQVFATEPATAASQAISLLEQQKQQKQNENNATQSSLNAINGEIGALAGEKAGIDAEISSLGDQIAETMASISLIEESLEETKADIEATQLEYDRAKAEEDAQYLAMKKRIKFLYEKGDTSYVAVLMKASSWSDMLNKAEYVQELYAYDQRMLEEYRNTVAMVKEIQEELDEQKSMLEADQYELEEEKASLEESLEEAKLVSEDYAAELSRARQEAAALKAQIKRANSEIKQLAAQQNEIQKAEEARIKAEEEAKRKAEEEERKKKEEEEAARKAQNEKSTSTTSTTTSASSAAASMAPSISTPETTGVKSLPPLVGSGTGADIAAYACYFVGNPYRAGGNDLITGCDCSGFVNAVYKMYGYSLPRNSSALRSAGREVDYASAQPGDILCYAGHVAIYLGGGRIVHASTPKSGIKYGSATYKTILSVRRIVG